MKLQHLPRQRFTAFSLGWQLAEQSRVPENSNVVDVIEQGNVWEVLVH
jgi:hypothetical protein